MPVKVYILWSPSRQRYYVGFSARGNQRLQEHRPGHTYWTSHADDWQQVWERVVGTREEARVWERKIKSRGAKRFLDATPQAEEFPDCGSGCRGPASGGVKFKLVTPEA